jgi:hypothetical protein
VPNWCHNTLAVSGPEKALEAFRDKVEGEGRQQPLTFAAHVPEPGSHESYDWYTWRCNEWGTKWDASFGGAFVAIGAETMDLDKSAAWTGVRRIGDELVYKFETAWSPPLPWLVKASEQEHELEFVIRFAEVGNDFAGEVKVVAGLPMEENELSVEDVLEPEEMWF